MGNRLLIAWLLSVLPARLRSAQVEKVNYATLNREFEEGRKGAAGRRQPFILKLCSRVSWNCCPEAGGRPWLAEGISRNTSDYIALSRLLAQEFSCKSLDSASMSEALREVLRPKEGLRMTVFRAFIR